MKTTHTIVFLLILFLATTLKSDCQVITIKKWKGTYPDMNGSYPLTFIAFKGTLIPVPHVFVRTWPTHYYVEAGALPVTDATAIAGDATTGILRIATKLIERSYMKGRYNKTGEIKSNKELQEEINRILFNARSDTLDDYYQLAEGFVKLYAKLENFNEVEKSTEVKEIFEVEADELLLRWLMLDGMETGHGEKLEAAGEIRNEQNLLLGEIDYTTRKMKFFISYNQQVTNSYSFLTR